MRKFLLALGIILAMLLRAPHAALAHFPATDGNVTAVLHVEPDDYPAAGQPETIYFIFSDQANHFKLSGCSCSLSISQQGEQLYYAPLTPPPSGPPSIYSTAGIPFSFPNSGSYYIRLVGKPESPGAFHAFNLSWNFRVASAAAPAQGTSATTVLAYFLAILGVFLLIGVFLFAFG